MITLFRLLLSHCVIVIALSVVDQTTLRVFGVEVLFKILLTDWMSKFYIQSSNNKPTDSLTDINIISAHKGRLSLSYASVGDDTVPEERLHVAADVDDIRRSVFSAVLRRCRDTAPTG